MAVWTSAVLWMASLSLAAGVGQNVARGKPAWMSTTRDSMRVASNAVDGVTTATEPADTVHTDIHQFEAWWKVDLQIQVQSAVVNIYFRTDNKYRRNGLQLYTSGTNASEGDLCHSVSGRPDGTDISDVLNVTCPSTWRYLTAYTGTDNDNSGAVIDFVEVQVWSCASGRYGASCSMECNSRHCHNAGDSCNSDTGACSNEGCQPGWAGPDCTACALGYYGANCDHSCAARHCKVDSVCDAIQGECVGGCAAGYRGTDCRQVCNPGQYGAGCSEACSERHCKTPSGRCHHVTGTCPDGCSNGFTGDDCLQACAPGYYGANCDHSCAARHCKVDSVCDAIHGVCVGGCTAGYRGTDCRHACASGRYGDSCIKYCNSRHCHNTGDSCPPDTGECSNAGCQPGWAGPDCTACALGYYGANCDHSCAARHCEVDSVCDAIQGECVGGCTAGYRGTDCRQDCNPGLYGAGCSKACSERHCKTPSGRCHHVTGKCPYGCSNGFTGDDCLQDCPDGYYGTNCSLRCADRHCNSSPCPADGACGAACEAGWTLQSCTQECPRGKYGISCNSDCGHCADSITCHHITGTCPGGCKAGWKLPLCKTAILRNSDSTITPVTAAMVGVAAGICFTVVLAVVLFVGHVKLWRFKLQKSGPRQPKWTGTLHSRQTTTRPQHLQQRLFYTRR